jgi:hypothetical protein
MASILNIAEYAVIAVGVLLVGWYLVKRFWPAAATSPTGTVIGSVADKAELASAVAALETVLLLCWARGDKDSMAATVTLRDKIVAFAPPGVVVTPVGPVVPTPGVPAVSGQIVTLKDITGVTFQVKVS